jgi:gliding motility-associated-like protein
MLFLGSGIFQEATASHAAGGELTYVWLSGNTFRFTLKYYRDCNGIPPALDSFGMCYLNTCSGTTYKTFLKQLPTLPSGDPQGTPVPTGCPVPTQCTNAASTLPGFEEWWYQGDVTLASQCTEWAFWVVEVARNPQYNIANGNLHIVTTLNNLIAPTNSSPDFSFKPVPYICVNQLWTYNNGAFDVDGDSLSYASITPYTTNNSTSTSTSNADCNGNFPPNTVGAAITFPAYNAATNAIPSVIGSYGCNPQTGIVLAIPNLTSQNVVTIEVTEWRNGLKIGSIIRDIQVAIVNCNVATPSASLPTASLSGLTFNPLTLYYNSCINDTIQFCVTIGGPDDTANILQVNNIPLILPGSSLTVTGTGTDTVQVCGFWVPTALDTGLHVMTIQYQDTNCLYNPIAVINAFSFPIYVIPATEAFGDTVICNGTNTQLLAVGGSSFTWSILPGGSPGSLSCTNCNNPIASPTVTTSYLVTSNLTTQCADNVDTVTIIVAPSPIVNAGIDTTLCIGSVYQMNTTVTIPAGVTPTYQWLPATFLNLPATQNPTIINPVASVTYTLTVIPNGILQCAVSDQVTVNVLTGMDILNAQDTTICFGDSIQIFATGSNLYNYLWTPAVDISNPVIKNPKIKTDTTRTYTLTASYPGCTDTVQSITVNVQPIPTVYAGPDRIICFGDTARLLAKVNPVEAPGFYSFAWSPAAVLNNATIDDPTFSGTTNTVLQLGVTSPVGCTAIDNLSITVVPKDFLTQVPDKYYCPGDTVTLTSNGGTYYLWSPGEYLSDSTANSTKAYPIATSNYTLIGVDNNGCRDTIYTQVYVAPNANLYTGEDKTIYPGETASLFAAGNCNNFIWNPPTGLSATNISNPIASPASTTQYVVIGTTEFGCTDIDTVVVNVKPKSLMDLANAFTPGNGNGVNDILRISHNGTITLNVFRIYNRWGQVVFETNDLNKGWDGNFNGTPQPIGTYVYHIDAKDNTGAVISKTGNVTLLR